MHRQGQGRGSLRVREQGGHREHGEGADHRSGKGVPREPERRQHDRAPAGADGVLRHKTP